MPPRLEHQDPTPTAPTAPSSPLFRPNSTVVDAFFGRRGPLLSRPTSPRVGRAHFRQQNPR
uniref:Uncharacterized protein n=1 Tax=Arundo donax TaxID=35708 RepID=A0A0A8ZAX1_ARUDO